MGSYKNCLEAAMIVFMVVDTIAVGLRLLVRTVMVDAFGLDDIVLLIAYLGYMLGCSFGFVSIYFGFAADPDDDTRYFNETAMMKYYAANQYTLYISSGLIKIAVALVLYRLACGLRSQSTLVISIIAVIIWTCVTTLFAMDLCATTGAASYTGSEACTGIGYFRMISNVFVDYFFALYPIPMLWNATLSQRMKVIVCSLLSLGILASAATIAKLVLLIKLESTTGIELTWLHIQLLIWADVELGLAIFCAAVAALRPLFRILTGHKLTRRSSGSNGTATESPNRGHIMQTFAARDSSHRAINADNDPSSSRDTSGKGLDRSEEDVDLSSIETTTCRPRVPDAERTEEDEGSVGDYHKAPRRGDAACHGLGHQVSQTELGADGFPPQSCRPPSPPLPVKVRSQETS